MRDELHEALARVIRIAMHLLGEAGQIGEFQLVAQLGDELDFDMAPVEVAGEVEQVRFQQRLHAVHRGARAEAGDRWPRCIAHAVHPGGVNAGQGGRLREAQVGGGETERAAELLAADDAATDGVGPSQEAVGRGEIAAFQGFADARA